MASNPSCRNCLEITWYNIKMDNMPAPGLYQTDRNILIRQHAVSVIAKAAKMYSPPDAYVPYLAMNYFDRFLSRFSMLHDDGLTKTKKVRLIALSCYALSANRRTTEGRNLFSLNDLLTNLDRDLDLNWIRSSMLGQMQHCICEKLNKKMFPVTAFWFLDHYYDHFKPLGLKRCSINEIVVQAQGEHTFANFMPTDIAFSACVAAATIALKELPEDINNMISNKVKEIVMKMIELCHRMNILIDKIEVAAEEIEAEKQSLAEGEGKGKAVIKESQPQMEVPISATQPMKDMNFELKWATEVPPLQEDFYGLLEEDIEDAQPRESTAISLRIPGTEKNINIGCCTCNIS